VAPASGQVGLIGTLAAEGLAARAPVAIRRWSSVVVMSVSFGCWPGLVPVLGPGPGLGDVPRLSRRVGPRLSGG